MFSYRVFGTLCSMTFVSPCEAGTLGAQVSFTLSVVVQESFSLMAIFYSAAVFLHSRAWRTMVKKSAELIVMLNRPVRIRPLLSFCFHN